MDGASRVHIFFRYSKAVYTKAVQRTTEYTLVHVKISIKSFNFRVSNFRGAFLEFVPWVVLRDFA